MAGQMLCSGTGGPPTTARDGQGTTCPVCGHGWAAVLTHVPRHFIQAEDT
jgi:hypothetical protein